MARKITPFPFNIRRNDVVVWNDPDDTPKEVLVKSIKYQDKKLGNDCVISIEAYDGTTFECYPFELEPMNRFPLMGWVRPTSHLIAPVYSFDLVYEPIEEGEPKYFTTVKNILQWQLENQGSLKSMSRKEIRRLCRNYDARRSTMSVLKGLYKDANTNRVLYMERRYLIYGNVGYLDIQEFVNIYH